KRWMREASPERQALVRHACRTLIKAGHRECLSVLGFGEPKVRLNHFRVVTHVVMLGEALVFDLEMVSASGSGQNLILDYVIHHVKANGTTSPKVFKWKRVVLKSGGVHAARRRHTIKPVTTRRYYSGTHRVEIVVNGASLGSKPFDLVVPEEHPHSSR
ncbi:MAG: DNA alkylation repair protein, partial [Magnetococcales bacterium]|nr:DNA alkylation repair protein [Magnetococcales bacterium]